MKAIRRILIPVDFQDTPLTIVHAASALARHFNSEILLLHVVAPLSYAASAFDPGTGPNAKSLFEQLSAYAEKTLHETIRPAFDGLKVSAVVVKGKPAPEIVSVAGEQSADLIVMATHGYSGFHRFLLGSVTAKVIHDASCPVLTAAHIEGTSWNDFSVKHVLCPVNFSEHSVSTLKSAADVAAEFNARLTLAHVTPGVEAFGPGGLHVDQDWKKAVVGAAREEIAKLQATAGTQGEVIVESGTPGIVLNRIAAQIGADLMILGSHAFAGQRGAEGYSIITASHIPVLNV